ncbi:putative oxidoreductase, short-chain dehydrogenase/reductase family [Gordonia polyisoprenivorans VH2]|uniref:Mycofactocin-coupled SDR family oxidoreductase n=2 Tax=Gordonia polyisoprenivorans TaxID=84595 RepID=A0A846WIG7_9ACTN|nr:mycofactocin-coupled SDR family oxidoreductase [Gordonia polyisoprenivorans]AFA75146.1 putative oxidoreductase, short-chain dehydrogenase/reductase family [Gordonia polyisoprenivorans VH2]MBE7191131.1 mycofactocin-coupled SDR family oxidoreductase [Gordonia polyisoprenivorans]NKY01525.1 mycofactocin-coupled SDR family oxidoreductase [Gordonia polyisoprenivorans]OZC32091.1 SDR family mycofactocin-dependent oxidoreductase [Gordonia polyisoprenivorans]QUD83577.1 mycofactocin-coupled SDR family
MGTLEGKVAFITGAARGQGRSHALRLAQEGADIIAVDITEQVDTVPYATARPGDLEETVRAVEALDRRIIASEVDVRDLAGLTKAAQDGVAALGRLDIVLANAGISTMAPTLEMDEQTWQTMIDINLTGVWKTVRAAVPHIVAGGRGGAVVLTSSLAAITTNENIAHYTAAKYGLIGLMRVLAKELGPQSIRVNTVHPTTVATDMILNEPTYKLFRPDLEEPTRADFEEAASQMNRLPVSMVEPIDISNAILYLVSDAGRYVTGTTQVIDAGGAL